MEVDKEFKHHHVFHSSKKHDQKKYLKYLVAVFVFAALLLQLFRC